MKIVLLICNVNASFAIECSCSFAKQVNIFYFEKFPILQRIILFVFETFPILNKSIIFLWCNGLKLDIFIFKGFHEVYIRCPHCLGWALMGISQSSDVTLDNRLDEDI
jgi:hypothetical protein